MTAEQKRGTMFGNDTEAPDEAFRRFRRDVCDTLREKERES